MAKCKTKEEIQAVKSKIIGELWQLVSDAGRAADSETAGAATQCVRVLEGKVGYTDQS